MGAAKDVEWASQSFVAVEEWADRDALDRHFAQPHLQEFAHGLLELVDSPPEVAIHEVAGTSDFPGSRGHADSESTI